MAIRYFAIVADCESDFGRIYQSLTIDPSFMSLFSDGSTSLYSHADAPCITLPHQAGIVVGHLFSQSDPPRRTTKVECAEAGRIVATEGQSLLTTHWGGYVACLVPKNQGRCTFLRDPSGTLPCYYLRLSGGTLVFSDIETAQGLLGKLPSIDWHFIRRHLVAFDVRTPQTAFTGVTELLAGHRLSLCGSDAVSEMIWSPWNHVHADMSATPEMLSENLSRTVIGCVRAWRDAFNHPLLGLSGGLDSSIIAACLADSDMPLTSLNLLTNEAEGDERTYARAVAKHFRLDLLERAHSLTHVDVFKATSAHLPRPVQSAFGQSGHQHRRSIAQANANDAFFTGIGGDNVFGYTRSASPLLDRLRTEGFTPNLWHTLEDICDLNRCTVWEVLGQAGQRTISGRPLRRFRLNQTFLSSTAATEVRLSAHPWLTAPLQALPGKLAHVSSLALLQGTIDGNPRDECPMILPLLSQPIVEASLRIPSWKWIHNGHDRAVVRRAFRGKLPDLIIDRRTKGGPNSFAFEVIERSKRQLFEVLSTGHLAAHGLLDLDALGETLLSDRPIDAPLHLRIGLLAETEAWLKHWSS